MGQWEEVRTYLSLDFSSSSLLSYPRRTTAALGAILSILSDFPGAVRGVIPARNIYREVLKDLEMMTNPSRNIVKKIMKRTKRGLERKNELHSQQHSSLIQVFTY